MLMPHLAAQPLATMLNRMRVGLPGQGYSQLHDCVHYVQMQQRSQSFLVAIVAMLIKVLLFSSTLRTRELFCIQCPGCPVLCRCYAIFIKDYTYRSHTEYIEMHAGKYNFRGGVGGVTFIYIIYIMKHFPFHQ